MVPLADIDQWRIKWANTGIYCTAYRYKAKVLGGGKGEAIWGHLYIDLDSKEKGLDAEQNFEHTRADALKCYVVFQALFGVSPAEIRCYFSGKKGVHLVIPAGVLGIQPHADLNMIFQSIAQDLKKMSPFDTIDTKIYDRKRLFRLPGSQHQETGLHKIPLAYDELKSLPYEQIVQLAQAPRSAMWGAPTYNSRANRMWSDYMKTWDSKKAAMEAAKKKASTRAGTQTLDYTPPCMRHIILCGTDDGKRNATAAVLANHYKLRGYSEAETMERMTRWNEERVAPPLTEGELRTTMNSIFRGEYHYGCNTLESLAPCTPHLCRMGSKRR